MCGGVVEAPSGSACISRCSARIRGGIPLGHGGRGGVAGVIVPFGHFRYMATPEQSGHVTPLSSQGLPPAPCSPDKDYSSVLGVILVL